jgi:hypothetical protein
VLITSNSIVLSPTSFKSICVTYDYNKCLNIRAVSGCLSLSLSLSIYIYIYIYIYIPTAKISRVDVRLPPFWAEWPAMWFAQAEVQFSLASITSEKTKLFYVISQLDHRYATEVEDIIIYPPERDPYTMLKAELVGWLTASKDQRVHQLLTQEEMGDRKLSQFLRHLRGLAPDMTEDFLRTIWASRQPPNIQAHLACQENCSLDTAARCANRISEVTPQPALASIAPTPDTTTIQQEMSKLSHKVAALSAKKDRPCKSFRDLSPNPRNFYHNSSDPRPGPRNRRQSSRSSSRDDRVPTLCWYHCRFRDRAQKCTPHCDYHQQGN